ncbi:hypothetical protein [Aeromonas enteropelogenes]|uniref:hypothetical protein n=1 Tax=Aeromonas enteropelogenes TaxID=29489 RepID=UPI001CC0FFCC|nr:hypothetical protein [Aeromonas enteropelogenes]UAK70944.1 hypothetical protein K8O95_14855 [Aeromonas enteropelogenes]
MIYRAITNLINAAIYLLTIAEKQATRESDRCMNKIEELEREIDEKAAQAEKAAADGMKCAALRNKLEGLDG